LLALLAGVALLIVTGVALFLQATFGHNVPSADEVVVPDSRLGRFLRENTWSAPLYLGIRLALAYEWLHAAWDKLHNPAWYSTGTALAAFWQRGLTVPKVGSAPIASPPYYALIEFMNSHHWYPWFAKLVIAGELLIGLGLLLGAFTGIAAAGGLLMNFNFLYAGSISVNPTLIILEALLIFGWRVAGYWGLDRLLLPHLGTPWAPLFAHRARRLEPR
jgi:thiosulfate dehydrogenase [quinone] large subunit